MTHRPELEQGPVRAVLLDMDDTLFDHSMTCRAAIASLRSTRAFLRRRPLDELWKEYLGLLQEDFVRVRAYVGRAGMTVDEARRERWRRLASRCGEAISLEEAAELSRGYRERYQRSRRTVPGARELLRRLHGRVKVVVVTNSEVAEQEEKVRFLGFGPMLDGLVVSEAVGAAKPDRRIFDAALAVAGTRAEQASMLGDSWASDVVGARGAGVRPVWFNRFGLPRPDGPTVAELRSLRPARSAQELLLGRPTGSGVASPLSGPSAL